MNEDIKPGPCPFCGGEIKAFEGFDEGGNFDDSWRFYCEDCDLETVANTNEREVAFAAFNRRPEPQSRAI